MKRAPQRARRPAAKKRPAPKSVDEYLARVPEPARSTLETVRATIRSAAPPEATETISYRMPAFHHHGILVWYAAFSDHCSLFPGSSAIEACKKDLEAYTISKGTIQFPIDKPLPAGLIRKLIKARVADAEKKAQKQIAKNAQSSAKAASPKRRTIGTKRTDR